MTLNAQQTSLGLKVQNKSTVVFTALFIPLISSCHCLAVFIILSFYTCRQFFAGGITSSKEGQQHSGMQFPDTVSICKSHFNNVVRLLVAVLVHCTTCYPLAILTVMRKFCTSKRFHFTNNDNTNSSNSKAIILNTVSQ